MHTDHDPVDPSKLAELGYEHRDVNPKPMAWAAFWLFIFTIGSGLLAALFIRIWNIVPEVAVEQRDFKERPKASPEQPILQNNSDNTGDIAALRHDEAEKLNSSADLKDGFYRIPIDEAIKDIVKDGMPKTEPLSVTHPRLDSTGAIVPGTQPNPVTPSVSTLGTAKKTPIAPTAVTPKPSKPAGGKQ